MSNTKDVLIRATGNGGDIAILNDDIALGDQLLQQAFLAMFGGNVAANTLGNELATEVRQDWWGNSAVFANNPVKQFNSNTERALRNNTLNSAGRVNIQRAAEADLAYLKTLCTLTVNVSVLSVDRCSIGVTLQEPNAKSGVLTIVWDGLNKEAITADLI